MQQSINARHLPIDAGAERQLIRHLIVLLRRRASSYVYYDEDDGVTSTVQRRPSRRQDSQRINASPVSYRDVKLDESRDTYMNVNVPCTTRGMRVNGQGYEWERVGRDARTRALGQGENWT